MSPWRLLSGGLGLLVLCQWIISRAARGRLFLRPTQVPARRVALVLGTSPTRANGHPNRFFTYRIDAATALYCERKVDTLLLSGHRHGAYNEPACMKEALLARGLPENALLLDEKGDRTLDSLLRARDLFGLRRLVIVSQRFHVERALFLARRLGIDAVGFCARDLPVRLTLRVRLREAAARVRALWDALTYRHPTAPASRSRARPATAPEHALPRPSSAR